MSRTTARGRLTAFLCAAIALIILFTAMCAVTRTDPRVYKYKSYLLQAQAWLRGDTALDRNYENLELAVYNDRYYVSFPPVPSVPMVLFTLIFGDNVPGGLFQKIYILIACMVILSELLRTGKMRAVECALWSVLFCAGSAMLPISLVGAVWYEAQILDFLFTVSAVVAMRRRRPTLSCLFYALSVGCRPFSVLLGPVLLAMHLRQEKKLPLRDRLYKLLPGFMVGLGIAMCYGVYNSVRFGDPLEFGHNYLPEFTRSEYGQLSVHYLWNNLKTLFAGSPWHMEEGRLVLNRFGFSMFLSCPLLICGAVWLVCDLVKGRMTPVRWLCFAAFVLNSVMLCMHRTLGGFQFGMRYALEMTPYCLVPLPDHKKLHGWELALMLFGLVFNFVGGCLLHV